LQSIARFFFAQCHLFATRLIRLTILFDVFFYRSRSTERPFKIKVISFGPPITLSPDSLQPYSFDSTAFVHFALSALVNSHKQISNSCRFGFDNEPKTVTSADKRMRTDLSTSLVALIRRRLFVFSLDTSDPPPSSFCFKRFLSIWSPLTDLEDSAATCFLSLTLLHLKLLLSLYLAFLITVVCFLFALSFRSVRTFASLLFSLQFRQTSRFESAIACFASLPSLSFDHLRLVPDSKLAVLAIIECRRCKTAVICFHSLVRNHSSDPQTDALLLGPSGPCRTKSKTDKCLRQKAV
jgi:hypothetical protein